MKKTAAAVQLATYILLHVCSHSLQMQLPLARKQTKTSYSLSS